MLVVNFDLWFKKLGQAWTSRDPKAVPLLMAKRFRYYETPFNKPYTTPKSLEKLWDEVPKTQKNVRFTHKILTVKGDTALANWSASFFRKDKKVKAALDGIFLVRLDKNNRATLFRQWWVVK